MQPLPWQAVKLTKIGGENAINSINDTDTPMTTAEQSKELKAA
jgi:hypothetical protein